MPRLHELLPSFCLSSRQPSRGIPPGGVAVWAALRPARYALDPREWCPRFDFAAQALAIIGMIRHSFCHSFTSPFALYHFPPFLIHARSDPVARLNRYRLWFSRMTQAISTPSNAVIMSQMNAAKRIYLMDVPDRSAQRLLFAPHR